MDCLRPDESTIITDQKEIVECFGEYFSRIGVELVNKIQKPSHNTTRSKRLPNSFGLIETSACEVKSIIDNLKTGKSAGIDGLRAELLQNVSDIISEPLSMIFNRCIKEGHFPEKLKVAVVTPIFKSGDRALLTNYRPISVISVVGKIFEKILKGRMVKFLEKYNILSKRQYGFQSNKSTEDAMANLISKIYEALDESVPVLCVFVDLSKAFDTVSHRDLLSTIEQVGFRGKTLELFKSYLENRKQIVVLGGEQSAERLVTCGVPQGTVLGPLLFCIYINELFNLPSCGSITSFADDTAVVYTGSSWDSLIREAQEDLRLILDFFREKLLTVNYEKTSFMSFTSYVSSLPDVDKLVVHLDHKIIHIDRTHCTKYLGIIVDSHLRWDYQIENLCSKLRRHLALFRHMRNFCGLADLRVLYFALVQSLRLLVFLLGEGWRQFT